ncbi:hypothetical protein [Amycolatopsis sp. NPDC059021]|uniref:hypothetical protein n=1 Tax=Amycolatopsis sp. NPDC059021 TaxID=3346704 RepID=UPI0036724497
MRTLTARAEVYAVLTDPAAEVPAVPDGASGVRWLRAAVARFSNGDAHARRRALAMSELAAVDEKSLCDKAFEWTCGIVSESGPVVDVMALIARRVPVGVLAEALGLPDVSRDVAVVARAYHPHVEPDAETEEALSRLVEACGPGADERAAARIGLLIQACDATAGLVASALLSGSVAGAEPPVRVTRRVVGGEIVALDLAAAKLAFGAGVKECPGRGHAVALVMGILAALRGFRVVPGKIAYEPSVNIRVPVSLPLVRSDSVGGLC